jgi:hypothetical protein
VICAGCFTITEASGPGLLVAVSVQESRQPDMIVKQIDKIKQFFKKFPYNFPGAGKAEKATENVIPERYSYPASYGSGHCNSLI